MSSYEEFLDEQDEDRLVQWQHGDGQHDRRPSEGCPACQEDEESEDGDA